MGGDRHPMTRPAYPRVVPAAGVHFNSSLASEPPYPLPSRRTAALGPRERFTSTRGRKSKAWRTRGSGGRRVQPESARKTLGLRCSPQHERPRGGPEAGAWMVNRQPHSSLAAAKDKSHTTPETGLAPRPASDPLSVGVPAKGITASPQDTEAPSIPTGKVLEPWNPASGADRNPSEVM